MVHGERAEVIKERVSQRCRMIGETVGTEEELRRSWQKKHGSSAVGLDAEIAKLRATHSAKYAFFETRENVRIKRAAFDARRASSVENERVARRFSLDSRRAAKHRRKPFRGAPGSRALRVLHDEEEPREQRDCRRAPCQLRRSSASVRTSNLQPESGNAAASIKPAQITLVHAQSPRHGRNWFRNGMSRMWPRKG